MKSKKITKWKSIVVALVLILGFVGYYIWDNCQKAKFQENYGQYTYYVPEYRPNYKFFEGEKAIFYNWEVVKSEEQREMTAVESEAVPNYDSIMTFGHGYFVNSYMKLKNNPKQSLYDFNRNVPEKGEYWRLAVYKLVGEKLERKEFDIFKMVRSFDNSLEHYVEKFYKNYDEDNFDITGYQIAAKENLIKGMKYSSDMILPSVILKVIKQLYDIEKNYDEVISLSKYILDNKKNIHKNMIDYVRFIKCQSLARQRKTSEFFDEVRNISDEAEREFLIGFLYRIQGKTVKAEECLNKALIGKGYDDPKIIGELIRVYMQNEEYEKAYEFSEKNYNRRPENLINVNDYFTCLLMKDEKRENRKVLENIISRLEIDPSDKAQEILLSMKARISLFYDNDCEKSFEFIEEAENRFPNVSYPLLTKADLAIYVKDYEKLRDAVLALDPITRKNAQTYRSYIKYKAILLAMENKKGDAIRLVMEELSGLNENNKKRLFEKINQYENIINLQKKR